MGGKISVGVFFFPVVSFFLKTVCREFRFFFF